MKTRLYSRIFAIGLACTTALSCAKSLPPPVEPLVPTQLWSMAALPAMPLEAVQGSPLVWRSTRLANGLEVRSVSWPDAGEATVAFVTRRGGSDEVNADQWYLSLVTGAAMALYPLSSEAISRDAWGAPSTDVNFNARELANGQELYADVPATYVQAALEQLAQRVQSPTLDQAVLVRASKAVLGWRRHQGQGLYARATARALAALYGAEFGPGQSVLDERKPTRDVAVHELHEAHRSRFIPREGALVVVAPHTHEDVVELANRFFGQWTTDTAPLFGPPPPVPQEHQDRFDFMHAPIADAHMVMVVHTPGWAAPTSPAFPVLTSVLGGGRGSRLYRALEEMGIPHHLEVEYQGGEHAGQILIRTTVPRDSVRHVERRFEQELFELARTPVPEAALAVAREQLREARARARETPRGLARELASSTVAGLSPEQLMERDAQQERLTPAALQAALAKLLVRENLSCGVVGDLSGFTSLTRWAGEHQHAFE